MDYREKVWLENTMEHWFIALSAFVLSYLLLKSAQIFLIRKLSREQGADPKKLHEVILVTARSTQGIFLFLLCLYFASDFLELRPRAEHAITILAKLALFLQIGFWGSAAISFFVDHHTKETLKRDAGRATTINAVGFLLEISIWIFVVLLALNNFGVNVSALIAGLGIGGIAIALAVQNLLGDLLASISIVLDKPFVMGDTISVGDDSGTVEHIGLKTTRLRSAGGEQLIFSNSDLLKSRIHNFQRMQERQTRFRLHLAFSNSPQQLTSIPDQIKNIFSSIAKSRFERCHLVELSKDGAIFEILYTTQSPAYADYLDLQHQINIAILAILQKEKISLAVNAGIPSNL